MTAVPGTSVAGIAAPRPDHRENFARTSGRPLGGPARRPRRTRRRYERHASQRIRSRSQTDQRRGGGEGAGGNPPGAGDHPGREFRDQHLPDRAHRRNAVGLYRRPSSSIFSATISTFSTARREEVAHVLEKIRGAADVQVQSPPGMPQLTDRLRHDDLSAGA